MIEDALAVPAGAISWSSEQFAAILRSVADGITVQDRTGRLVYANAAAVALLGFATPDELLNAPTEDVLAPSTSSTNAASR